MQAIKRTVRWANKILPKSSTDQNQSDKKKTMISSFCTGLPLSPSRVWASITPTVWGSVLGTAVSAGRPQTASTWRRQFPLAGKVIGLQVYTVTE